MNEDFKKIEKIICDFKDDIKQEFRHQIGIQSENFQRKLDIVVEGQQMLTEKIDRVKIELKERIGCVEHKLDIVAAKTDENTARIDLLSEKIDAVAADLTDHRRDTEAHSTIYKVKEE